MEFSKRNGWVGWVAERGGRFFRRGLTDGRPRPSPWLRVQEESRNGIRSERHSPCRVRETISAYEIALAVRMSRSIDDEISRSPHHIPLVRMVPARETMPCSRIAMRSSPDSSTCL